MPCEVYSDPGVFGGAPTFVCGDGERARCTFCAGEPLYLCDWPVERFELAKAHEIRHGDVVRSEDIEMRILEIQAIRRTLVFQVEVLQAPANCRRRAEYQRVHGLTMFQSDPVFIRRGGTCDRSICEAHAREVGEERHYCSGHWNAWLEVS